MAEILQKKYKDNYLISSYEIGKSKPIGYQVPDKIYGKQMYYPNQKGVKDAINDWQLPSFTERQKKISNFVEMNILGAKKGVHSLKGVQEFRSKNPITKQQRQGSVSIQVQLPDSQFVYGKPNWQNVLIQRQDQQMGKILQYEYKKESDLNLLQIYQKQEEKDKQQRILQKNSQNQSSKCLLIQNNPEDQPQKELFKMKKFQNIDSRYKSAKDLKIDWQDVLNVQK